MDNHTPQSMQQQEDTPAKQNHPVPTPTGLGQPNSNGHQEQAPHQPQESMQAPQGQPMQPYNNGPQGQQTYPPQGQMQMPQSQPMQQPVANRANDYMGMHNESTNTAVAKNFLETAFMPTLNDAYAIGIKNIIPIMISTILWALTCWIPYINVGTTIAMFTIPLALSKGESISPTFIFDKRYRQFLGEFFLTSGLLLAGVLAGALFVILPAFVVLASWMLAPLLVLDKGYDASKALTISNKCTYGNKLLIFLLFLALLISLSLILGLLALVLGAISEPLVFIAIIAAILLVPATSLGLWAAIYKRLVVQNPNLD